MSDDKSLVFANKTIDQMANSLGVTLTKQDYMVIRLTFRKMGGSWSSLVQGDPETLALLASSVRALVQSRAKESE